MIHCTHIQNQKQLIARGSQTDLPFLVVVHLHFDIDTLYLGYPLGVVLAWVLLSLYLGVAFPHLLDHHKTHVEDDSDFAADNHSISHLHSYPDGLHFHHNPVHTHRHMHLESTGRNLAGIVVKGAAVHILAEGRAFEQLGHCMAVAEVDNGLDRKPYLCG